MNPGWGRFLLLAAGWPVLALPSARAARIGDRVETEGWIQVLRFISLEDPSVRFALAGAACLGVCCGLLGSFILVRRLALVGDALSHAVLPGVALGFLWNLTKDPVAIFIGATLAGLLGTVTVSLIRETTAIKEDSALGMVLAGFYGLGICLFTMIQNLPGGNKAGIDKYLFGQAAALSGGDVTLMLVVTVVTLVTVVLFYKELLVSGFDPGFAGASGFPVRLLHHLVMLLLAFAVVVALQAVGVVLVSAMLITPAATAYLLTDRFHRMLALAAVFGLVAGFLGVFFSFLGNSLPTGPFMVLAATLVFVIAFLAGPRHGLLPRVWRRIRRNRSIQIENTLKAVYQVAEAGGFTPEGIRLADLAARRSEPLEEVSRQARRLVRDGLATVEAAGRRRDQRAADDRVHLTPAGWERARRMVRNHRLWELYLTNLAHYETDHVHDDAEVIEHVLGEETVRQLERRLAFPTRDPHGRAIPGPAGDPAVRGAEPATPGYHNPR